MQKVPIGWKGTSLLDVAKLVTSLISGSMNISLIVGRVGGPQPGTNVGPWINGDEWWFWDPTYGYVPSQQGCPIGTVAMWGGGNPPARWLLCDHAFVSTVTYARLFGAIGYTWGAAAGAFRLPPGGRFYFNANASNTDIDPNVPSNGSDVASQGGAQSALFSAACLPALVIEVPYQNPSIQDLGSGASPNATAATPGAPTGPYNAYPVLNNEVRDGYLAPLPAGGTQQPTPTMPPFALCNFIIKYL